MAMVGDEVGDAVDDVGESVGDIVGDEVGDAVGDVGESVGDAVGSTPKLGLRVGVNTLILSPKPSAPPELSFRPKTITVPHFWIHTLWKYPAAHLATFSRPLIMVGVECSATSSGPSPSCP
jgi:phage tail tape-measure protein